MNLIDFKMSFKQNTDYTGRPTTKPLLQIINAIYETTKDIDVFAWSIHSTMLKKVIVEFSPSTMSSKTKRYEFYDVACTFYKEGFNGQNSNPTLTTIGMSAAIFKYENTIHEKSWKITDLNNQIIPTVIEDNDEKEVLKYYITDVEGNELDEYKTGDKIILNIKTKNRIGDSLTIHLDDKTHDFKYKGQILKNDILRNYKIANNLEQIELEVINQQELS